MLERIQKIISAAGVTSRRAAEQLILDGRVRVNGQVVTELGTKADASKDHIKVDGKLINPHQPMTYIMLNKPAGFVTTMSDPEGRPTVQHLLKGVKVRVYPVGRLDYNTEGLLLLTNDGDFAHLITHPKHEFPKTYRAKVKGVLEDSQIDLLEKGIYLDDGRTAPAKIKKVSKEEANSWLEITIHEGKKRQVRRMFDRVGHSVIKLKRIRTGNLVLGDLPEGSFRYLTPDEVGALKELAVKEEKPVVSRQEPAVRSQELRVSKEKIHEARVMRPREGAGVRHREPVSLKPGDRRSRPEKGRDRAPVRAREGVEGRRQAQAPRVPGMGASGRGPRRPPSDEGKRPIQGATFTGPGAGKSAEFKDKTRKPAGAIRPGRESWGQGAAKSFAFKPGDRKAATPRSRGKVFDKGFEQKPATQRTASPFGGDRKPQRSYGRPGTGEAPARGRSFDKGFGPKPATQRTAGQFGGDRKPQRSYGRPGTGEAPARGKVFDKGFAPKPGTQRTAGPVGGDRKPQRSYGRQGTGEAPSRGRSFDKGFGQKPGTQRTAGPVGGDRKPQRSYGRPESGKAPVRGGGRKPYRSR